MRAKQASQRRSLEKRERILDGLDALLRRKPFSDINIGDVARQAKVSPATIYQRFSNVDATASVLLELYYRKVEEWASRARRTRNGAPASLFDALVAVAADGYDQVAELGYVMRPAYLYSRHRPDQVGADWKRLETRATEGFKAFLRKHSAEVRTGDLDEAAAVICYLFNMLLLGPLLHDDGAHSKVVRSRREFARTIATVAYRYLTAAS